MPLPHWLGVSGWHQVSAHCGSLHWLYADPGMAGSLCHSGLNLMQSSFSESPSLKPHAPANPSHPLSHPPVLVSCVTTIPIRQFFAHCFTHLRTFIHHFLYQQDGTCVYPPSIMCLSPLNNTKAHKDRALDRSLKAWHGRSIR